MIKSYFFIPASQERFLNKIPYLTADEIILDFEDGILPSQLDESLENINKLDLDRNFWVRPSLFDSEDILDVSLLKKLSTRGFCNFVIPKLSKIDDLKYILDLLMQKTDSIKIILLIENPKFLMDFQLLMNSDLLEVIKGCSIGTHDYCASSGMKHTDETLSWPKNYLLNLAKAAEIECIDSASMNIQDKASFQTELISAIDFGYDAKFFLHPFQLEILRSTAFFSKEEIQEAIEIISIIEGKNDIPAIRYKGRILERPHLKRIQKIFKWYHNDYKA